MIGPLEITPEMKGQVGRLVSDWPGHRGFVRRISASYRGMDEPGGAFTCRGRVIGAGDDDSGRRIVQLEVWTANGEGQRTTEGAAEIVLHPQGTLVEGKG